MENEALKILESQESNDFSKSIEWVDIDMTRLSYGGILYPKGISIQVKRFSVEEVRFFTGLQESEGARNVNRAIGYLLENCVRIKAGQKILKGIHIFEHDRFSLVLMAREISDLGSEMFGEYECHKCGSEEKAPLNPGTLEYKDCEYMKKFDGSVFNLNTKKGLFKYLPLTYEESTKVLEWSLKMKGVNDEFKVSFLKLAPFLRFNNEEFSMKKLEESFMELSKEQISILDFLSRTVPSATGRVTTKCSSCGEVGSTAVSFRSISDIVSPIIDQQGIFED